MRRCASRRRSGCPADTARPYWSRQGASTAARHRGHFTVRTCFAVSLMSGTAGARPFPPNRVRCAGRAPGLPPLAAPALCASPITLGSASPAPTPSCRRYSCSAASHSWRCCRRRPCPMPLTVEPDRARGPHRHQAPSAWWSWARTPWRGSGCVRPGLGRPDQRCGREAMLHQSRSELVDGRVRGLVRRSTWGDCGRGPKRRDHAAGDVLR